MSIHQQAAASPDKPAVTMADSGDSMTFRELDARSTQLAHALRRRGMTAGDRLAILLPNSLLYYVAAWAARRSTLRYVPLNWHLHVDEVAYIVDNCDARALVTAEPLRELAQAVAQRQPSLRVLLAGSRDATPFEDLAAAMRAERTTGMDEEADGNFMFYSSGTTGYPKGILRPLTGQPFGSLAPIEQMTKAAYGFGSNTVYLSPAPLYHAAPLGWSMAAQGHGGTVIAMERFDAENVLRTIERYRVTHAQFVPTHFFRLLQLPGEVRARYDLSSLRMVVHAAAPCPIDVKERMIQWWGPIIHEYYSASEGGGFTAIDPQEWLRKKGSVGRSLLGPMHIIGEDGRELPAGEVGLIYFENAEPFEYHKAAEKTAEYFNDRGWGTMGDMGWVDADGYLFLADRKSHMIISGGVNIYPQEIENLLAVHPKVADVAVIGVPNAEFGEEVKAVVIPAAGCTADDELAHELIEYCREHAAGYKCPRSVDFVSTLPRLENGKLLKRELRKRYWPSDRRMIGG
ncbi:MAG: acyl-CoA synthetase [Steroidobacteraceae bacterium]